MNKIVKALDIIPHVIFMFVLCYLAFDYHANSELDFFTLSVMMGLFLLAAYLLYKSLTKNKKNDQPRTIIHFFISIACTCYIIAIPKILPPELNVVLIITGAIAWILAFLSWVVIKIKAW